MQWATSLRVSAEYLNIAKHVKVIKTSQSSSSIFKLLEAAAAELCWQQHQGCGHGPEGQRNTAAAAGSKAQIITTTKS
jgi:hypothetical protein